MPLKINIANLYKFLRSTEICMRAALPVQKNVPPRNMSSPSFQLTTPLCIK